MSRQKVVDSMITGTVSSSKLDGALPAINGANLTGVGDGVLKGGNDPATDTNPAAGVIATSPATIPDAIPICKFFPFIVYSIAICKFLALIPKSI